MLQHIHIRDLAIVTNMESDFQGGLTVLTGETGAGKSILIDALGLVLGDRADKGMIREGSDRAEITALFHIAGNPTLIDWLHEQSLESENACLLRRVIVRDGSSRAYINGSPVPVRSLQTLGRQLVDIHGQHAHQSLLRRDHQRQLLDDFAGHQAVCKDVTGLFHQWRAAEAELGSLRAASRERSERIDLLRYQIDELEALALGDGELQSLDEELRRLNGAERLLSGCGAMINELYDDEPAVVPAVQRICSELEQLAEFDPCLGEYRELLENAVINIQEAVTGLRHYRDNLEMDPERLRQLDQRLSLIHELARKQHCKPETLNNRLATLKQELDQLESDDLQLSELESRVETLRQHYLEQAEALDRSRRSAASRLCDEVSEGMNALGMSGGSLELRIETLPEERAAAHGINSLEFLVCTNPGQGSQPLAKIASGGELSRISLAIQVATANWVQVPTLIFDEVDVGIGGGIAEIVGRLLRQLGNRVQVLCVTHLPQVASQGHQHLQVVKTSRSDDTQVQLKQLTEKERVAEIARMLGGVNITDQTLAHAEEMAGIASEER